MHHMRGVHPINNQPFDRRFMLPGVRYHSGWMDLIERDSDWIGYATAVAFVGSFDSKSQGMIPHAKLISTFRAVKKQSELAPPEIPR